MKSNGIFIFLPLLDSITINLIMIFLYIVFIKFYNHELKVFSYLLSLVNSEIQSLNKSYYVWPLSNSRTLNLDQSSYILPLSIL
jgi:type IV secretory pathway VirB3-like protein